LSDPEIVAFQALRERLRCKEIWVIGADRWRNPDEDLPQDFEERRVEHYAKLRKPLDPGVFIDEPPGVVVAEDRALAVPWGAVGAQVARGRGIASRGS
jgi:hypothetical protein